jgi:hypothetical protein
MPSQQILKKITFTPLVDSTLLLTVSLDTQGAFSTGQDWNTAYGYVRLYVTQNAVTTYADNCPVGNTRESRVLQASFSVLGGLSLDAGVRAELPGTPDTRVITGWNFKIVAEEKR